MPRAKLSELLEQLPPTDKELPQPPPRPEDKKTPRPADPDPNGAGSKFNGPPPQVARQLVEQLFAGGRRSIAELVDMVHAPGDDSFKNYKPEYLLHCAALYAGNRRNQLISALTSRLGRKNVSPATGQILLRELQWLRAAPNGAMAASLLDKERCHAAAAALLSSEKGGMFEFRKAWPKAGPECRLAIAQALGRLKAAEAAPLLRQALGDRAVDVRLVAAWSLAQMADEPSASGLIGQASRAKGYERAKLISACLELAHNLHLQGKSGDAVRVCLELSHHQNGPGNKHIRDVISRCINEIERSRTVS